MSALQNINPFLILGSNSCKFQSPSPCKPAWALGFLVAALGAGWGVAAARAEATAPAWPHPLVKKGKLNSPLVEVTPFVFADRLYRLENWRDRKVWERLETNDPDQLADEMRIREMETDKIISVPLRHHTLGTALVWGNKCYVLAGHQDKQVYRQQVSLTFSEDLVRWSHPLPILRAAENEHFFNVAVCRGRERFVLLVETDDPAWPAFTFKYFVSDDLKNWGQVPEAIYGRNKYVGGPDLFFEGDYYYTLYLESLAGGKYETRITRSKDLIHWQDAPDGRPFVTFDPANFVHPVRSTTIHESNASDPALCYWKGKTQVYFTGGDQQVAGDLQWAEFDGTPQALFEHFYAEASVLKPSARQLHFQENQLGCFVHFGLATYTDNCDMFAQLDPAVFNPVDLDADQWIQAAKAMGAKHVVLTAKHHSGFCLWPTETTDYSVRRSPWRQGRGDVVREFVEAARRNGLEPGLYISGADQHEGCLSSTQPRGERKLAGDIAAYFPLFMKQLRELVTGYGNLAALWFDGYRDPFAWDVQDSAGVANGDHYDQAIAALIRQYQPQAVIFREGTASTSDARWAGNESGWAPYPVWYGVEKGQGRKHWLAPEAAGWFVPEANLPTRANWFWTPNSDATLRSAKELVGVYYDSIGRGANVLVNLTPNRRGRLPEVERERIQQLGAELTRLFAHPLAQIDSRDRWDEGNTLELRLSQPTAVNRVVMEEEIAFGQRIRAYRVEIFKDKKWTAVAQGESIGRQRIERFDPVMTDRIRLRVLRTDPLPRVRRLAVYGAFAD